MELNAQQEMQTLLRERARHLAEIQNLPLVQTEQKNHMADILRATTEVVLAGLLTHMNDEVVSFQYDFHSEKQ
jgi:hypothetical protein